jgi:hypothetical protein
MTKQCPTRPDWADRFYAKVRGNHTRIAQFFQRPHNVQRPARSKSQARRRSRHGPRSFASSAAFLRAAGHPACAMPTWPRVDWRCEPANSTADQPLDLDVAAATLLDAKGILVQIAKVLVDTCFTRAGRDPGCTRADKPSMEFLRRSVRPEPPYFGGQSHQAQNRDERSRSFQALGASCQTWAASASCRPMV